MLPEKYQHYLPGGSGEEDFWMFFTIYGHGGHLQFLIKTILAIFRSPRAWMLHMKFGYIWPSGFRGEVVWKCGRTTEASHPISSFRSGELKKQNIFSFVLFSWGVCVGGDERGGAWVSNFFFLQRIQTRGPKGPEPLTWVNRPKVKLIIWINLTDWNW